MHPLRSSDSDLPNAEGAAPIPNEGSAGPWNCAGVQLFWLLSVPQYCEVVWSPSFQQVSAFSKGCSLFPDLCYPNTLCKALLPKHTKLYFPSRASRHRWLTYRNFGTDLVLTLRTGQMLQEWIPDEHYSPMGYTKAKEQRKKSFVPAGTTGA